MIENLGGVEQLPWETKIQATFESPGAQSLFGAI